MPCRGKRRIAARIAFGNPCPGPRFLHLPAAIVFVRHRPAHSWAIACKPTTASRWGRVTPGDPGPRRGRDGQIRDCRAGRTPRRHEALQFVAYGAGVATANNRQKYRHAERESLPFTLQFGGVAPSGSFSRSRRVRGSRGPGHEGL